MNAAVDILAVTGAVQSIAFTGAALIFGLRVVPQLRVAPPQKQPEAPKQATADHAGSQT